MITENLIADDRIEVLSDGTLQIREATVILRDGVLDPSFPPSYRRYVLHPGDILTGKSDRIQAVAGTLWTPAVIDAWASAQSEAGDA